MDFSYSADQEELRTTVRRFLADKSPRAKVREDVATDLGYDAALWRQMSEQLGLPGLHLPEEHGGSGTGLLEPAVVLEETGRALASSPYTAVLLSSLALLHLGSEAHRKALLPGLAGGETLATLATIEVASPTGTSALQTTAQSRGDQVTLTGTKTLVEHGHSADVLLVSAVGDGGAVRLYVVQGDAPGLTRTRLDALDLTRPVAEVRLEAVPAVPLGEVDGLDGFLDVVCALLACEMVGGTTACLEMATAYAKDRFQFNRPIGSFQAVKHRLAEMVVALDGARAAAQYAVFVADSGSPELATVAPLAKAEASEAYTFAAGWNVQVHGGVGFTWEQDAHLYFRRAWSDSALYGSPAAQRARLADRLALSPGGATVDLGLAGRVFVVTGGSRGLGLAGVEALRGEGAQVVLSGRDGASVAASAARTGARGVVADQGDPDGPARVVAAALETYGRLDGALVSVGGPPPGTALDVTDEQWRSAFDSVFLGAVRLCRAVVAALPPEGGSLALVLSTSVRAPLPGLALSNGLRPGLGMLAKTLADELGPRGVRVNGLLPGRIATDRLRELGGGVGSGDGVPLGRDGDPAEFGRVAAFLLSPAASYVTGVMLPVDGGAVRAL